VRQKAGPWARPGSGFSLPFEALLVAMLREMPVRAVAWQARTGRSPHEGARIRHPVRDAAVAGAVAGAADYLLDHAL
jgi:hypothetical protein